MPTSDLPAGNPRAQTHFLFIHETISINNEKSSLYLLTLILVSFCSNNQNSGTDCSLVDCFGGDMIKLNFFKNGENIFEIEPSTEIEVIQNNENTDHHINTFGNEIEIYFYEDTPVTI